MARPESVAVGGYFPTPQHLVPLIMRHLDVMEGGRANWMDPCAGDGAALTGLWETFGSFADLFTCEMEATRHADLVARLSSNWQARGRALLGDAFLLEFSRAMSLLLLNPPYDTDPVHGRLEQRFLERFTTALVDGGVIVYIVPHYALKASAETLAREYDNVRCFRFPPADFAAFKQVVLFAAKTETRLAPDGEILERVRAWSESVQGMPLLGSEEVTHPVPSHSHRDPTWKLRALDLFGLLRKYRPWRETSRGKATGNLAHVPHILPEVPVQDLLFRVYPIATPPRPAHIAAGIASGLFNGRQVESDTPGMPKLLVKGVFTREYSTVAESVTADGDVMLTQVQAPKLETTVLNLKTRRYAQLAPAGKGEKDQIDGLSIEGLLKHYGPSLMDVMLQQCPVSYDAKRDAARLLLKQVARDLYTAQGHAARALYQLLGGPGLSKSARRFKSAILLGEVGTGKTATVLSVGQTMAKRMLAFCPPHLLADWQDETAKVIPNAVFKILQDPEDVDALREVPTDRVLVAVVSRERAKLGHGWEGVNCLGCPKCGATLPTGIDLAKKRARCEAQPLSPRDDLGRAAYDLALKVAPHSPKNGNVVALLSGRHLQRMLAKAAQREGELAWGGFDAAWVRSTTDAVTARLRKAYSPELADLLYRLLLADYQPERIAALALAQHAANPGYEDRALARLMTCMLPEGELRTRVAETTFQGSTYYNPSLSAELKALDGAGLGHHKGESRVRRVNGRLTVNDQAIGSLGLAHIILSALSNAGRFTRPVKACGEPLFQAAPHPRRYPLSDYIAKYFPDFFDLLVLDEGQDYQNGDSAQGIAAHRLTSLGIPTILMTGSLMNGYAASLFTNMWHLSPSFRAEFGRDELQKYLNRYGYTKRVVSAADLETEIVAFGSHSDRVERTGRLTGYAPGILPLFLFRHLLAISVTLHKADLDIELPPCEHITAEVEPSKEQKRRYEKLVTALKSRIKKDQFDVELSGKLFGALSELPSYLDRASEDAGNQDDGSYGIYYPESVGGNLVAKAEPFAVKKILPKEQWMIDTVKAELAEGRNVMVLGWHVSLLPRLARLLEKATGETVPIFYSDAVPTGKRKAWINKNIVAKGVRIMVANPVGISTGLNNLVHFSTEVWMENPGCNPQTFRQTNGRIHRIGQGLATRIYFPIYKGTLQATLHRLLMIKVAVSTATDGLDSESVLLAAGAGDDAMLMGLSIGRQLWEMISKSN